MYVNHTALPCKVQGITTGQLTGRFLFPARWKNPAYRLLGGLRLLTSCTDRQGDRARVPGWLCRSEATEEVGDDDIIRGVGIRRQWRYNTTMGLTHEQQTDEQQTDGQPTDEQRVLCIEAYAVEKVDPEVKERVDEIVRQILEWPCSRENKSQFVTDDVAFSIAEQVADILSGTSWGVITRRYDLDMYEQTNPYYVVRVIGRAVEFIGTEFGTRYRNALAIAMGLGVFGSDIPDERKAQLLGCECFNPRGIELWRDYFLHNVSSGIVKPDTDFHNRIVDRLLSLMSSGTELARRYAENCAPVIERARTSLLVKKDQSIEISPWPRFPMQVEDCVRAPV